MKAIEAFELVRQELPSQRRRFQDHDAAHGIVNAVLIGVLLWSAIIAAVIAITS